MIRMIRKWWVYQIVSLLIVGFSIAIGVTANSPLWATIGISCFVMVVEQCVIWIEFHA